MLPVKAIAALLDLVVAIFDEELLGSFLCRMATRSVTSLASTTLWLRLSSEEVDVLGALTHSTCDRNETEAASE